MPGALDAGDRKLLIAAGCLVAILVVVSATINPPQAGPALGIPSSYSATWSGAKAAFLLLRALGYQVDHWERPPTQIPYDPKDTVLVLAEPRIPPSEAERQALRRFLNAGGRILATGGMVAFWLPEAGAQPETPSNQEWKVYRPLLPSPLARGAAEIAMSTPANWEAKNPSHLAVYGEGSQSAVVTYHVGKGRVVWWASPTALSNGGIREKGNLALLLNSLGLPERTHVLWDEYYHGLRGSLWSYLGRTPLPWAIAQLGLFLMFVLATFSRRSGPDRAPAAESRLSPLEFVETLGDLYRSAHARAAAVGIAYQRFRFVLSRRLGLPANAAAPQLAQSAARRLDWGEPAVLDLLGHAERAMRSLDLRDAEALELVQQLHDSLARLERARHDESETRG